MRKRKTMINSLRNVLIILLTMSMTLSAPAAVLADALVPQIYTVKGERLSPEEPEDSGADSTQSAGDESSLPLSPVYFGVSSMSADEADSIYRVPVYRDGDISAAASVTVHTLDITALYGKDYILTGGNITRTEADRTLLEIGATEGMTEPKARDIYVDDQGIITDEAQDIDASAIGEEDAVTFDEYEEVTDITGTGSDQAENIPEEAELTGAGYATPSTAAAPSEAADPVAEVSQPEEISIEEGAAQDASEADAVTEVTIASSSDATLQISDDTEAASDREVNEVLPNAPRTGSPLAAMKEAETGMPTRETITVEVGDSLTDSIMAQLTPEMMSEITYSSEKVIRFAPGEDTAFLEFRLYDDNESEGQETFSVVMTEADGAEIYKITTLSVVINDNEETIHSKLSFSKESYECAGTSAMITIERTGAVYSVASADLTLINERTGEETLYGTAAFAPYETVKNITLDIYDNTKLSLGNFMASEPGEFTEAAVHYENAAAESEETAFLGAYGDASMNIKIDGKDYVVRYNKGDADGIIYNEIDYDIPLEVGRYFFSVPITYDGGMFKYDSGQYTGSKPWGEGTRTVKYVDAEEGTDYAEGNGHLQYYHTTMWKNGTVYTYTPLENTRVDGIYYQYLIPHWEEYKSVYGGQESWFYVSEEKTDFSGKQRIGSAHKNGEFSKSLPKEGAIQIKNRRGRLTMKVAAEDCSSGKTPKTYVHFYGIAAMYKKYRVSITDPARTTFKSGSGTVSAVPAQYEINCGAQILGINYKRDIYANVDEKDSNLVFTVKASEVNGIHEIFGTINGYKIIITPENDEQTVILNYPDDFISFLKSDERTTVGNLSYSPENVSAEVEKVKAHLDTIPMDAYFIDWIETNQKGTITNTPDSVGGKAYYQSLQFTPLLEKRKVTVESANIYDKDFSRIRYTFNDSSLPQEGLSKEFYAGDLLDLSAICSDAASYKVIGYQYSTDGGAHYNTITDTNALVLLPGKNYLIRPAITENSNHVEVVFASSEARFNLNIENILNQEELKGTGLEGRTILNLNPDAKSVTEKMDPQVGKIGAVKATVVTEPRDPNKRYRVVFTDRMTGRKYSGNEYDFILRQDVKDNVIVVDIETVDAASVKEKSVSGTLVTAMDAIRSDGLGEHIAPVCGYSVYTGNGSIDAINEKTGRKVHVVNDIAAQTNDRGEFSLSGLMGRAGEVITLVSTNGRGEDQIFEAVLSDEDSTDLGTVKISYPSTAPYVSFLMYDYDKSSSRERTDLRNNSVRVFDDNLTITAGINAAGRDIEKLVYTVVSVDGERFSVDAQKLYDSVFTVKFEKMLDTFHNGDRILVRVVDSAKQTIRTPDGTVSEIPIEYPDRETGFVLYIENEIIAPKYLTIDSSLGSTPLNIPLIGDAAGKVQSGVLGFSRTDWPNNAGYSLNVNFDALVYSTHPTASPQQKMNMAKAYLATASQIAEQKSQAAELDKEIANLGERAEQLHGNLAGKEQDYNDLRSAIDQNRQMRDRFVSSAKDEAASLTKGPVTKISVMFVLDFEFVYDPIEQEYILATIAVTVGGSFDISKTWYTLVGYVPCFLNLSGGIQANLVLGGTVSGAQNALSEGHFDQFAGNIRDVLGERFMWETDIVLRGKIQVGAGLCGILAARGYIDASVHGQFMNGKTKQLTTNWGAIINAAGGIGFDLVLASLNVDIAKVEKGWGTLKTKTKVSFLNNTLGHDMAALRSSGESGNEPDTAYQEEISVSAYQAGTADLSSFGASGRLTAQPVPVKHTILLDHAADRTRSQLVLLPDGRKVVVFIGSRESGESGADSSCLYYSIIDQDGNCSVPEAVCDDGTYDTTPSITAAGNKVIIAWADADKPIEELEDFRDQYNAFGISMAVYDAETNVMGDKIELTSHDPEHDDSLFFNIDPEVSVIDDRLYCTFLTRDISGVQKIEDMADFLSTYSTMQIAEYDMNTGEKSIRYIAIRNRYLTDPLVMDYNTETVKIEDEVWVASTFTVDTDNDFNTSDDRKVYLALHNVTAGKDYYPIDLAPDEGCRTSPKLTRIGSLLYLTWLEDGDNFRMLDVTDLLHSMFYAAKFRDIFRSLDPDDPDWYRLDADQLHISSEQYADSIYRAYAESDFVAESKHIRNDPDQSGSIGNYQLASDGKDLYIFWTDFGSDIESTGQELYGMRYIRNGDEPSYDEISNEDTEGVIKEDGLLSEEDEENKDTCGFTDAVQITEYNKVIDDFSLVMDEERHISLVSDYYSQWIDEESGKIQYSSNALAEIEFVTQGSVSVVDGSVHIPKYLAGGQRTEISFDIVNSGLMRAEDCIVAAKLTNNGAQEMIQIRNLGQTLETNEHKTVYIPWTVPKELNDASIQVLVLENETDQRVLSASTAAVDSEAHLKLSVPEARIRDNTVFVDGTVTNEGNRPSRETSVQLFVTQYDEGTPIGIVSVSIPALASGESYAYEISTATAVDYWNQFGQLDLTIKLIDSDKNILDTAYTEVYSPAPVQLRLSVVNEDPQSFDDLAEINIKKGETAQITCEAAPWGALLIKDGQPVGNRLKYVSSDENVAVVTQDGKVTPTGDGTCVIRAVSAEYGLMMVLPVISSGFKKDDPKDDPSGDDHHSSSKGSGWKWINGVFIPSHVNTDGTWRKNADGTWNYLIQDIPFDRGWLEIYNPYADVAKGQIPYGWFYFDTKGVMQTGWHVDPDKHRYYLNPVSDNTMGMMFTGWQLIDHKWYYFREQAGTGIMGSWDETAGS